MVIKGEMIEKKPFSWYTFGLKQLCLLAIVTAFLLPMYQWLPLSWGEWALWFAFIWGMVWGHAYDAFTKWFKRKYEFIITVIDPSYIRKAFGKKEE